MCFKIMLVRSKLSTSISNSCVPSISLETKFLIVKVVNKFFKKKEKEEKEVKEVQKDPTVLLLEEIRNLLASNKK